MSSGRGVLGCLCLPLVWLEDLSAASRLAVRQPNGTRGQLREHLFSGWQVLLFQRAGLGWLGIRNSRGATKIEGDLADSGLHPDRME